MFRAKLQVFYTVQAEIGQHVADADLSGEALGKKLQ